MASLKVVLAGAGIAMAAGLAMGAAAKPDLVADDRPEGPQIMAGWSGVRSTGPFDDGATFARANGQVPDYVLGTDWKKALNPAPIRVPVEPPERLADNDAPPPAEDLDIPRPTDDEPPRAMASYPSLEGGAGFSVTAEPDGVIG
jgi:hypothetical protein